MFDDIESWVLTVVDGRRPAVIRAACRRGVAAFALTALLACATSPAATLGGQDASPSLRQVVLTFDDLPLTGSRCDSKRVDDVTTRLTQVLRARGVPSAGLVTTGGACTTPAMLANTLAQWKAAGAVIGNHTHTHPDLNTTAIDAYLADIDQAQVLIKGAVGEGDRWFRAPLLHMGNDQRKKRVLQAHLSAGRYRIAPVTIDNQEWVYAAVYARAHAAGDLPLARRIVDAYVEHLEEAAAYYEQLSNAVFGREIPQVLLLHASELNAAHLDRVIDMLRHRGYEFVRLADALGDEAYGRDDTYVGSRGLSWLQRWAMEDDVPVPPEPREAAWVAEAFRNPVR